jgi:hypothetical protein
MYAGSRPIHPSCERSGPPHITGLELNILHCKGMKRARLGSAGIRCGSPAASPQESRAGPSRRGKAHRGHSWAVVTIIRVRLTRAPSRTVIAKVK